MRLLLDTHVLLWWLSDDPLLLQETKEFVASPENQVFVSAATVWEIAIKRALGKLSAPGNITEAVAVSDFEALPITLNHAEVAGQLPPHHQDPFDRMLIAQCQVETLALVSKDAELARYDVTVVNAF